jgi:hypothetical protein
MHEVFEAGLEPTDASSASLCRDELRYRLRQQSLLGEFGSIAMQTRDLRKILQQATELCAIGLQAPFVKVLEYEPDEDRLMVRVGVAGRRAPSMPPPLPPTSDRRQASPIRPDNP